MKIFKTALALILTAAILAACGKKGDNPDKTAATPVPLIKGIATTTRYNREVFNYKYDDQKRLISTGYGDNIINPITYNLGGLQIVSTSQSNTKRVIDFNLEDGRIKTAIYNIFINQVNQNITTTSTFSYDTKGRVIKVQQLIALSPPPSTYRTLIYTYKWDDNDNLVSSNSYDPAKGDDGSNKSVYSGFSAENVNTLSAKNFGLDYFGATSFNGGFYASGDGTSGGMTPIMYPGKILPTIWKASANLTFKMVYHKNAQGFIDRIEQTDVADPNNYYYVDIAYQ